MDSSLPEFIKNQHNDQLSVVSQRSWVQIPYRPDIFLLPIFITAHVVFINATIAFIFIINSVDKTKLQSVTAVTATFQYYDWIDKKKKKKNSYWGGRTMRLKLKKYKITSID